MQIPGVVWAVVLVALPLLAEWLTTYFGGSSWAAPVAALLGIVGVGIAKWIEVSKPIPQPPPGVEAGPARAYADESKLRTWLIG